MSRTPAARRVPVLAVIIVPAFLAALALAAFSWTSARLAPRSLPLGVAGPQAAAAAEQHLAQHPGAFSIHYYPDEARAAAAVRHRSVYGAIVINAHGATVLTASAASPLVARLLSNAAATAAAPAGSQGVPPGQGATPGKAAPSGPAASPGPIPSSPGSSPGQSASSAPPVSSGSTASSGTAGSAGSSGTAGSAASSGSSGPAASPAARVRVVDLVPADRRDPQGIAFGAALLPLVLVGAIGGVVTWMAAGPAPLRAAVLLAAAAAVGLIGAGLIQGWLGIIPGNWVANGGVIALTVLAISAGVCGLASLAGHPGLVLGGLLMVFYGNPFSAAGSAPEMLPVPEGTIGQLLPPGAGQELLRSAAYFSGNGSAGQLAVLIVWAAAGITTLLAGDLVRRRRTTASGGPVAGDGPAPGSGVPGSAPGPAHALGQALPRA